ncbi:MAG: tandem-95 repeat protein [Phycisphaera sp. RhM]|nr:tandem-95 repeat protein [Phycisphaera sp. RhM]
MNHKLSDVSRDGEKEESAMSSMSKLTMLNRLRQTRRRTRKRGDSARRHLRRLISERLEDRHLLTAFPGTHGGDVNPDLNNNFGFETAVFASPASNPWQTSSDGGTTGQIAYTNTIHPGGNFIPAPENVWFGYGYVKKSYNPAPGQTGHQRVARTVTLFQGETLRYQWFAAVGNDGQGTGTRDYAYPYVRDGIGGAHYSIAGSSKTNPAYIARGQWTGWREVNFTAPVPGAHDYRLGVIGFKVSRSNVNNSQYRVTVGVDNVRIVDNDRHGPTIQTYQGSASDGGNNYFSWNVSDPSGVNYVRVRIYNQRTNALIKDWKGAPAVGSYSLNAYCADTYRMHVEAWDNDTGRGLQDRAYSSRSHGNYVISDDDRSGPSISTGEGSGSDGGNNYLSWGVSDSSDVSYVRVRIYNQRTGQLIRDLQNTNASGRYDMNHLPPDTYKMLVQATDNDTDCGTSDRSSSSKWHLDYSIVDDDTIAPSIGFVNARDQYDGEDNTVQWSIGDASGIDWRDVRLQQFSGGSWGDVPGYRDTVRNAGSFDLNSLGLGTFRVYAHARDNDEDWGAGDRTPRTLYSTTFKIEDDDIAAPVVAGWINAPAVQPLSSSNHVGWNLQDASGVLGLPASGVEYHEYEVWRDGVKLVGGSGPGETGSVDLEPFGPGQYDVKVRGTDADNDWGGDSQTSPWFSRVVRVNAPPTAGMFGPEEVVEGDAIDISLPVLDPDGVQGIVGYEDTGANGDRHFDPQTGVLSYVATLGFSGLDSFQYRVFDGYDWSEYATISINVLPLDTPPEVAEIPDFVIDEKVLFTYQVNASDDDGDPMLYELDLVSSTTPGNMPTIDPNTGRVEWTPDEATGPGTYIFEVSVSDLDVDQSRKSTTVSNAFSITVNEVNESPRIPFPDEITIPEMQLFRMEVTYVDDDIPVQNVALSLRNAPTGMSLVEQGGHSFLEWIPGEEQDLDSPYQFDIVASDGVAETVKSVSIVVREVNRSPVIPTLLDRSLVEGDTLSLSVNATDPDIVANTLTYRLGHKPNGMTIDPVTGLIQWTPVDNQSTDYVEVFVSDNTGTANHESSATFNVTVSNDSPDVAEMSITYGNNPSLSYGYEDSTLDLDAEIVVVAGTFEDSGLNDSHTVLITWGDGAISSIELNSGERSFSASHTYADDGLYQITSSVSDNDAASGTPKSSGAVIYSVNESPIVSPQEQQGFEDIEIEVDLRDFVTDVESADSNLTFALTGASKGSAILLADGFTVRFSPNEDFHSDGLQGEGAYFDFTVEDEGDQPSNGLHDAYGLLQSASARIPMRFSGIVDVEDDAITTVEDIAGAVNVLANDSFGPNAVVSAVTQGANGSVVLNGDGTVTYTPSEDYHGADRFSYTVTTAAGNHETADVEVTVESAVDIADDVITTEEDVASTINVLTNDGFGPNAVVSAVTQGEFGVVSFLDDGTVTYTPNDDYYGPDEFTYTVTTAAGIAESGRVVVSVNNQVDISDDLIATAEDSAANIDVLANDSFEDAAAFVSGVTQGASGAVAIEADGTVTYTPDADFHGNDSFTYTVTTNVGGATNTETATVNVTVASVSDIVGDSATTNEDTSINLNVLANDSFEDAAAFVSGVTQGASGSVAIEADGTVTYTPDADFHGNDSFSYTITTNVDGATNTETATVNVTVNSVVDIVDDIATTNEDTSINLNVLVNDNFEDVNAFVSGVTQGASGAVVIEADGTVTYTPAADFHGNDSFSYTVTTNVDGATNTETATVNVTVNSVSDIVDDSATTNEDTSINLNVLANDSFEDAAAFVSGVTQGANGSVVIEADGTVTYTPNDDFHGSDSFQYTVTTNIGGVENTETATVNVTVNNLVDVAGRVFNDLDNDGTFDGGQDSGLAGISVAVFNESDDIATAIPIGSTTSQSDGTYFLNVNLNAGNYKIVELLDEFVDLALLDGNETAGNLGGSVDNGRDSNEIKLTVGPAGTMTDAIDYTFAEVEPSDLYGRVWRDFNNDGELNYGEYDINGVDVVLEGVDDRGNIVNASSQTSDEMGYAFTNLRPGTYVLREVQPSNFDDGGESLGEVVVTSRGLATESTSDGYVDGNDKFAGIKLAPGSLGDYYNFAELPQATDPAPLDSPSGLGFWHNKQGQALIERLSDAAAANQGSETQLGDWLAATFPRMYGAGAYYDAAKGEGRDLNFAGKSDEYIAETFAYLHRRNAKTMVANGGAPKVDAHVLGVALSVFATSETLAGTVAQDYGFSTSADGIAYATIDVLDVLTVDESEQLGLSETIGNIDENGNAKIIDILIATDKLATMGLLYDSGDETNGDGDGSIDNAEQLLRKLAHKLYGSIS